MAIELLPDVLLHHRMHHGNLSRREGAESRYEFLHIVKASLDRRRDRNEPSIADYRSPRIDEHAPLRFKKDG